MTSPRANGVVSAVTPSTLAVNRNPVRMSPVRVRQAAGVNTLSGTVVASSVTRGRIGADGTITIQLKKKGSKKWVSGLVTGPDEFGAWVTPPISSAVYPAGTQFRALLRDCKWCADATQTGRLR